VESRRAVFLAKEMCVFRMDCAGTILDHIRSEALVPTRAGNQLRVQHGVSQVCVTRLLSPSYLTSIARYSGFVPVPDELWWNKILLLGYVTVL